ncbi:MAG: orotidine-5'-phosphate decarboxylase [Lachnospiraceae bacterium]|nr:orotidine-5'-phosphate decarboxylase [Lachnospiraceae bacterium]MCD7956541.1 orotidine-5'-phosphate decarboxylase [Lachnospiraceae bacterium]
MIQKLIAGIKKTNAPVVVGLDPMLSYIPESITKAAFAEYGETLEGAAEAIWQYNKKIIDAVYDLIPAVKPQIAMYEQFGIPGLVVFKKTVDYCHAKDLVVIGDVKRGDIGSTSAAYATAHLGHVQVGSQMLTPFGEDFATVNPYLGTDGIKPFLEVCREEKKGIFVLVKTSNPSSGEFQDRLLTQEEPLNQDSLLTAPSGAEAVGDSNFSRTKDSCKPLYEVVGEKVAEWADSCMGDDYSYVGAVVGATYPEMGRILRRIMPKSFILVPGYGAQGGKAKDLAPYFNEDGLGAIVNSSRGIIAAYKQEKYASFGADHFAEASRAAVVDMIEDINSVIRERLNLRL